MVSDQRRVEGKVHRIKRRAGAIRITLTVDGEPLGHLEVVVDAGSPMAALYVTALEPMMLRLTELDSAGLVYGIRPLEVVDSRPGK